MIRWLLLNLLINRRLNLGILFLIERVQSKYIKFREKRLQRVGESHLRTYNCSGCIIMRLDFQQPDRIITGTGSWDKHAVIYETMTALTTFWKAVSREYEERAIFDTRKPS
jgi:hypothetical protein